jgi:hypothetical protein
MKELMALMAALRRARFKLSAQSKGPEGRGADGVDAMA